MLDGRERRNEGKLVLFKVPDRIPNTCVELILRKRILCKVYPNTLFSDRIDQVKLNQVAILDLRASSQSISKHANSDGSRRAFSPKEEFKKLKSA
ncbi:hypothetical protein BPAE_0047g00400 [Botrytis paeoniae]|uniref:Uncharacterized protein n=1 Tax=Botrytis paeoniae TaxID=278948 RepID=A0A4Z1FQS3_9HELO|nr:hypothetical protein BPAE_0047g00400 [Botrytis paeoniae]